MAPSLGGSRSGTSTRRPGPRSSAGRALEQQPVLEHAAAEDDGVQPRAPATLGARPRGGARDRAWKRAPISARRPRRRPPRARRRRSSRGRRARPPATRADRRRARRGPDRLELHRRLALVADLGAQAAERGDGVEEPAHARRQRRGQPGACELGHRVPGARLVPRRAARARAPGRDQPRAGHPPRLAHAAVAAGQAHGPQVARALEARQAAGQQLAAPHRPVGAVARCRRRSPRWPARLAVLGQARPPGGRGGAARRRARRPRGRARSVVDR